MQGYGGASPDFAGGQWDRGERDLTPWFNVRLTLTDGRCLDVVAVVHGGRIAIEDIRCSPPLLLDDFDTIAAWIAAPLQDACRTVAAQHRPRPEPERGYWDPYEVPRPWFEDVPPRQGSTARPRGRAARRMAAEAYQRARQEGRDPILAVMYATGRSRRRSLRLVARARDDGYLSPRHNRR